MMDFLLALTPILVVLIGMIGMKKSAMVVAPVAMVYTLILGAFVFSGTPAGLYADAYGGVKSGLQIIWLIFAAFTMLVMMTETGAMDKTKELIAGITNDKRVQIIVIAVMFGIFLEGVAGAGSPAAIAAPFLMGLGFSPMTAAVAPLIANAVPVSFGGAGVTTIMGTQPIIDTVTVAQSAAMVGRIHMVGAFLLPFIVTLVIFGKKGFKGFMPFLLFSGLVLGGSVFFFSNFIGPEVTSMCTGLVAMIASVGFLKVVKLETPEEYQYQSVKQGKKSKVKAVKGVAPNLKMFSNGGAQGQQTSGGSKYTTLQAVAPYLILSIILPVIRYTVDFSILAKYGYTVYVGTVILFSAFLGSLVLRVKFSDFVKYAGVAAKRVVPAMIAMCTLLVLSNVMKSTGMIAILAEGAANLSGGFYPFVAVAIGSLGAFMTGTGLGSNIMFGPMHVGAASSLGLNPITIFAGQNAGASLGNMICTNNVVAVGTTVGLLGKEGELMKRVFPAFLIILVVYGTLAMIYTHTIFASWGL